jgi:hypothetical protein
MRKKYYLSLFLRIFGIANLITAFGIPLFFGDLLLWTPRNLPTELMVGSLYFAMGIMMLVAALLTRWGLDPLKAEPNHDHLRQDEHLNER